MFCKTSISVEMLTPPQVPVGMGDLIVLKEKLVQQQQQVDMLLADRAAATLASFHFQEQLHAQVCRVSSAQESRAISRGLDSASPPLHRRFDRSVSEPPPDRVKSSRYKTELCRPFEETGACKYGEKCQFAHGAHELRVLPRHPKYKTEMCRTFHTTGLCPYGPRCHFVHNPDENIQEESYEQPKVALQQQHVRSSISSGLSYSSGSLSQSPLSSPGSLSPKNEKTLFAFDQDALALALKSVSIDQVPQSRLLLQPVPEQNRTNYLQDSTRGIRLPIFNNFGIKP
ncbi:PREDICTED: protein TIS11-like [Priapulus caudatus]|uniref:Protein TIS11-like n=1 Tax=Priapulus caudatus TaxID=37621 RepID=A0ABM1DV19_PRICU|nr:PREDICTED: protein TIS11-like [Priapulus caudatus]